MVRGAFLHFREVVEKLTDEDENIINLFSVLKMMMMMLLMIMMMI